MVVFNSCNRRCTNITKIKPPRKNLLFLKDRVHTHVPSSTSGDSGCRRQELFRQSSGMPGSGFHHSTLHYYTSRCVHTAALLLCFSLLYMSPLFPSFSWVFLGIHTRFYTTSYVCRLLACCWCCAFIHVICFYIFQMFTGVPLSPLITQSLLLSVEFTHANSESKCSISYIEVRIDHSGPFYVLFVWQVFGEIWQVFILKLSTIVYN